MLKEKLKKIINKAKKGFTLLELLIVLVIMAALAVIAVPIFINKADEAKQLAQKATMLTLENQAQSYIWEVGVLGATEDILSDMIAAGYIKEVPENLYKNVPNNSDKTYVTSVDSEWKATAILTAGTATDNGVTYNKPDLVEGMVPVKWNGTSWTLADVANTANDWYKYNGDLDNITDANKNDGVVTAVNTNGEKWANVMLRDGCNGSTAFNGSMMVWIPRYTYKVDKTNKRIYIKYTAGAADDTSGGYLKHPAFKLGSQELTGIWVAKFEASPKEGVGNSIATDDVTTKHVQVKPDVSSWRYISIGKMFTVCRNMNTDTSYG
ncbi:MAG TPA: hypothetical protein DEG71_03700, partial [Clostridiales bacterium]|nr:hypothetical protein [Clostridiales bacterium]